MSHYVIIHYGPCDSFHTVVHKPQKLKGLRDRLRKLGYRVDLVPVRFVNYCMLEMCAQEVFRCNINNLRFDLPLERDPVCQRAVNAVLRATTLLSRAQTHRYLWHLIDDQMFKRGEFAPKDYFCRGVIDFDQISLFNASLDCEGCCFGKRIDLSKLT